MNSYSYEEINSYNASRNPSTIHASNTGLQNYFKKYLLNKTFSRFKFTIPDNWDLDYLRYTLFCNGFAAILETDKYGVIPQACSLSGYNIFYRPSKVLVANPLLSGIKELTIGTQCAVVKLLPDYTGLMDMVNFYADMMALCAETAGTNLINSKLSYIFTATDRAKSESFKKLYDKVASGEPAVVIDRNLFDEDGKPMWDTFAQNLQANYIAGDILTDMRKWEMRFLTQLGFPNANTDKKERLISDEVNSNNEETQSLVQMMLDSMNAGFKDAKDLFEINASVELVDLSNKEMEVPEDERQ